MNEKANDDDEGVKDFYFVIFNGIAWIRIRILFNSACAFTSKTYTTGIHTIHVSASELNASSRRTFVAKTASIITLGTITASNLTPQLGGEANAVGPVKLILENPVYSAKPCPKDKPIPGQKAMLGMRGLCVTVKADLQSPSPKDLEKVGVYGFVIDAVSGESVLANNPDLSTDAGQFAMIESVTPTTKSVEFEFVAAIPKEVDISQEELGITPLQFDGLRIISFPGGQQYGAINPCEMNEFSSECDDWEEENGPYKKGDFMVQSNARTKGR